MQKFIVSYWCGKVLSQYWKPRTRVTVSQFGPFSIVQFDKQQEKEVLHTEAEQGRERVSSGIPYERIRSRAQDLW